MRDVGQFLSERQKDPNGEIAAEWAIMEEFYNKKLWHQLTLHLLEFVKQPALQKNELLIELYNNFLQDFENKINPLSLVEIIAYVVRQFTDPAEAITFLEKMEVKVKANKEAVALCKVFSGQIKLHHFGDEEGTKKLIEEIEKILEDIDGVTPVHGRFYFLSSELYLKQGKHADYYRAALRFLGCTDLDHLTDEEKQDQAYKLGIAALLGEGVYNFGELLAHPVLESLKDDKNWLVKVLYAFNAGNLKEFDKLKNHWGQVEDLRAKEIFLKQKISLLCLMEMTFKRPATDRQLTFEEIASEAQLPLNEVELLVMKALAQGLVKGSIDQVAAHVHMTWVQPRVLDKQQVSNMIQRLDLWCKDVQSMEILLESRANDILTL